MLEKDREETQNRTKVVLSPRSIYARKEGTSYDGYIRKARVSRILSITFFFP